MNKKNNFTSLIISITIVFVAVMVVKAHFVDKSNDEDTEGIKVPDTIVYVVPPLVMDSGILNSTTNHSVDTTNHSVDTTNHAVDTSNLSLYKEVPVSKYYIIEDYNVTEVSSIPSDRVIPYIYNGFTIYLTEDQYYDIDQIARIVYAEAANQSYEGRLAVASVIMNRVTCDYYDWGGSVYEVLSAPYQFSTWQCSMYYEEPNEENLDIAFTAYIGNTNLPEYVLFFQRKKDLNGWGSYPYYITIQDHSFYSYYNPLE